MPNSQTARVKKYLEENDRLLRHFKLAAKLVVNFPKTRKAPLRARFAIWLLNHSGAILDTEFRDFEK